jgi:hypothetical protein
MVEHNAQKMLKHLKVAEKRIVFLLSKRSYIGFINIIYKVSSQEI